jgi:hypothetical protein
VTDLAAEAVAHAAPQNRAIHPKGWEPHVVESGGTATAVSAPMEGDPSHDDLIRAWGMDPGEWAIVGDVQVRRWQTYDERWLRYYRASLTRRVRAARADVDELCKLASSRRHKPPKARTADGWVSFVAVNDWQIGKADEDGGGTPETVEFLRERFAMLDDMWKREKPAEIVLGNEGDITERVYGNYPSQPFTVDLDEREQQRVARRLTLELTSIAARRAPVVRWLGVPCNHGENRQNGKMVTRVTDSVTLSLLETTAEACALNPDSFGHVRFELAPDIALVTDLAGICTVHTHGHQFDRGSGSAMVKAMRWWDGQITGMQPAAAAVMMVTAHKHHFEVTEEKGRTVALCPASDGGSRWWKNLTGQTSPRGMLTMKIGAGIGDPLQGQRCWDDLRIL